MENNINSQITNALCNPSETTREDISSAQRWAVGLIDGDGHIGLEYTDKKQHKWVPSLKVSLHASNARAIYKLKTILGVGKITTHKNMVTLRVRQRKLWLSHLVILFDKFPLRTDKYYDYVRVKKALCTFVAAAFETLKAPPTKALLRDSSVPQVKGKLSPVVRSIKNFHHNWLKCHFVSPFLPQQKSKTPQAFPRLIKMLDLDWLAGFVEADGSFYILKSGTHGFALGQAHNRDLVYLIHQALSIPSKLKIRPGYIMLDTKNKTTLLYLGCLFHKRLLGIKSFELALWLRTLRKNDTLKSLKARDIILAMRQRVEH